jgi:hypothetical protein
MWQHSLSQGSSQHTEAAAAVVGLHLQTLCLSLCTIPAANYLKKVMLKGLASPTTLVTISWPLSPTRSAHTTHSIHTISLLCACLLLIMLLLHSPIGFFLLQTT